MKHTFHLCQLSQRIGHFMYDCIPVWKDLPLRTPYVGGTSRMSRSKLISRDQIIRFYRLLPFIFSHYRIHRKYKLTIRILPRYIFGFRPNLWMRKLGCRNVGKLA